MQNFVQILISIALFLHLITIVNAQDCSDVNLRGKWKIVEQSKGDIGTINIDKYPVDFGDTGFGRLFFPVTSNSDLASEALSNANYVGKVYFEKEKICGITYFHPQAQLLGVGLIEEVQGYSALGGLLQEEYMVILDYNTKIRYTWILEDR